MALTAGGAGTHIDASSLAATTTTAGITTQATGSGIHLVIDYYKAGQTFTRVEDSKANTWVQIGTEILSSDSVCAMRRYYCANAIGGSAHTFSLVCNVGGVASIAVTEVQTTNANGITLDQEGAQTDDTTPYISTSETTTIADEILMGAFTFTGDGGVATHTWGNSFTLVDEETNADTYFPLSTCYRVVSATGTYNTTCTVPQAIVHSVNSLDTFSEAAAGATQPFRSPIRFAAGITKHPRFSFIRIMPPRYPAAVQAVVFRKTLSGVGTKTGSRQQHNS